MVRPVLDFTGLKSRTHQSFAKDADINNILTTKEAVASSPYFESFLHKGAVWFKVDRKNRNEFNI